MKVQTERVICEKQVFIADDGTRFDSEKECKTYEFDARRAELKEKLKLVETCEALYDFAPFDGAEYMDYHEYHWYRPKNEAETMLLMEYYNLEYAPDENEWVCIESDGDSGSWEIPLGCCISYVKRVLKTLGYDVIIAKGDKYV